MFSSQPSHQPWTQAPGLERQAAWAPSSALNEGAVPHRVLSALPADLGTVGRGDVAPPWLTAVRIK